MKKAKSILFDTSVFISAFVRSHPHHDRAISWVQKIKNGDFQLLVSAHTLLECYSILTGKILLPRISPSEAQQIIKENILRDAKVITLTIKDYSDLTTFCSTSLLSGGIVYDAQIYYAAKKGNADHLLTFNQKHFRRIHGSDDNFILSP